MEIFPVLCRYVIAAGDPLHSVRHKHSNIREHGAWKHQNLGKSPVLSLGHAASDLDAQINVGSWLLLLLGTHYEKTRGRSDHRRATESEILARWLGDQESLIVSLQIRFRIPFLSRYYKTTTIPASPGGREPCERVPHPSSPRLEPASSRHAAFQPRPPPSTGPSWRTPP